METIHVWANKPIRKNENKFILMDNVVFHFKSVEVMEMALADKVYFVPLPKNATYFLQPLDVSFFGAFKTSWRLAILK